jgi:glutamate dehydrogenase/leucine dehydrogenase
MFRNDKRQAPAVATHPFVREPGNSNLQSGIYTVPVFEMARRQFDQVADHLDIEADERQRIFLPKRAIAVSCPIHRDDGSVAVFNGAERRGDIFIIPDILCNAGGVIVSYFEWVQDLQRFFWDESEVLDKLYRALERSLQRVMARSAADGITNRDAAMALGVETVCKAKGTRGLFP